MQVYVQKSTSTTLPRRPSGVSGGELSQAVAPSNDARRPSNGRCEAGRSWSVTSAPRSASGDIQDGRGERIRGLLRKVVPDAADDGAVLVGTGELRGVGARIGVRRAVRVAFEGDARHGD